MREKNHEVPVVSKATAGVFCSRNRRSRPTVLGGEKIPTNGGIRKTGHMLDYKLVL